MKKLIIIILALTVPLAALYSAEAKPIVTVLDFNVSQVSEQEAAILVDYISSHLVESEKFRVIDRSQRMTILKELQFSYNGCTDEECQLEIGKLLAARYIFIGSLGKLGTRYIFNISLVEVETGEALKSVSDKYNNLDSLVDDTSRIVDIFTGNAQSKSAAVQPETGRRTDSAVKPPLQPAEQTVQPPAIQTGAETVKAKLKTYWGIGFQVGGAVESETSVDGPGWGLYIESLIPVSKSFYLGALFDFITTADELSYGAVALGASAILGDPGDLAFGLGFEVSDSYESAGGTVICGSGTVYVGDFDIRICYGEDMDSESPVAKVGVGVHF